jgi:hypothetical protein
MEIEGLFSGEMVIKRVGWMRIEKDQTVPEWNLGIKWAPGPEITVLLDSLPNMVGLLASYSAQPVRI